MSGTPPENDSVPPPSDNGAILLNRVVERDKEAFGELYDRFFGVLFSVVISIVKNESEAEDVLQETFLKIWRKADRYSSKYGQPVTWFMAIARNTAIDRVRARKVLPTAEALEAMAGAFDTVSSSASVPNEVVNNETAVIVRDALEKLPEEQRHAISLAFFSGLTQSEIAKTLDQPIGTVKARIRRGMLRLRGLLGDLDHFSPSSA